MKRIAAFLIFSVVLSACFGQTFNCYQRNEITGTYQIKNIEDVPEQYHFKYSRKDNQIVGYYYDSSKIKFIDEIAGSRITKSTYFSKATGSVLYEKEFFYGNDSKIESFTYKQLNDSGDVIYEAKYLFHSEGKGIAFSAQGNMISGNFEYRFTIDGSLSENYKPVEYKVQGMVSAVGGAISQNFHVEETFSYDGYSITSRLLENGKLHELKRRFKDGNIKKYEEIIFNADEEQVGSKQYILNGSVFTQIIKSNSETVTKYDYTRIDDSSYLLCYSDWNREGEITIEISDEIVSIRNRVVENIKYPISLFDFSILPD